MAVLEQTCPRVILEQLGMPNVAAQGFNLAGNYRIAAEAIEQQRQRP
jgi:hypothetical protein